MRQGDPVSWSSHGGEAHGKIVRKLTVPMRIKDHKVAASRDKPEFLVETAEGERFAHKPGALRKDQA